MERDGFAGKLCRRTSVDTQAGRAGMAILSRLEGVPGALAPFLEKQDMVEIAPTPGAAVPEALDRRSGNNTHRWDL